MIVLLLLLFYSALCQQFEINNFEYIPSSIAKSIEKLQQPQQQMENVTVFGGIEKESSNEKTIDDAEITLDMFLGLANEVNHSLQQSNRVATLCLQFFSHCAKSSPGGGLVLKKKKDNNNNQEEIEYEFSILNIIHAVGKRISFNIKILLLTMY